jgi:chorismate mutase
LRKTLEEDVMSWRGIRGATSVDENKEAAILDATRELLGTMCAKNDIAVERIVSVFFTVTPDLNAAYPAQAAREIGWQQTPLLCAADMDVPGSLQRCVRVLMHADLDCSADNVRHVYLGEARSLRPDWSEEDSA